MLARARLEAVVAKTATLAGAAEQEAIVSAILEAQAPEHQLNADLFTGFNVAVSGNPQSIDVLKDILTYHPIVKSLRVFDPVTNEYTVRLNYTQLKELRQETA